MTTFHLSCKEHEHVNLPCLDPRHSEYDWMNPNLSDGGFFILTFNYPNNSNVDIVNKLLKPLILQICV
jgi:hypothetical protein